MIREYICGIRRHVEKECTRCHKLFRASDESQDVCPGCLNDEFASGVAVSAPVEAPTVKNQSVAMMRQKARANRFGKSFGGKRSFNSSGAVRCSLAVFLFAVCVFMFLLSDGEHETFLNQLEYHYQLSISLGFALISTALLLPSFSAHKTQVGAVVAVILLLGISMPSMWHFRIPETEAYSAPPRQLTDTESNRPPEGRMIQDKELEPFIVAQSSRPDRVHYSIFVRYSVASSNPENGRVKYEKMDAATKNLIKKSLSRLLRTEKVDFVESRTEFGVIYTVSDVLGNKQNISTLLGRYGDVYYSDPVAGIYEVALDQNKINSGKNAMVAESRNPNHPAYTELNMQALRCLDPGVVCEAANELARSNVNRLRSDIVNCLLGVLQEPWEKEPATYKALVEALVVYATDMGNAQVVDALWKYFDRNVKANQSVSIIVTRRLVKEVPDRMAEPVWLLWQRQPDAWNEIAGNLVQQLEPHMIEQLERPDIAVNEQRDVLGYLKVYGTSLSLPVLQRVSESANDLTVKLEASDAVNAINGRASEPQK